MKKDERVSPVTETTWVLEGFLVLMSGEDPPADPEEEIRQATRELETAVEALRAARGKWSGAETVDVAAIRRALDLAERQLDAARVRLARAKAAQKD